MNLGCYSHMRYAQYQTKSLKVCFLDLLPGYIRFSRFLFFLHPPLPKFPHTMQKPANAPHIHSIASMLAFLLISDSFVLAHTKTETRREEAGTVRLRQKNANGKGITWEVGEGYSGPFLALSISYEKVVDTLRDWPQVPQPNPAFSKKTLFSCFDFSQHKLQLYGQQTSS